MRAAVVVRVGLLLAGLSFGSVRAADRPKTVAVAAVNAAATITVDATANRHAIDPRIYGVSFADAATITDLGLTLNRWGGNTSTRYNWQTFWANLANDWCFYNFDETSPGGMGKPDDFVTMSKNAGAQPVMTVPMIGWTADTNSTKGWSFSIAKYGAQDYCDQFHTDAGKGILTATGQPVTGNVPTESSKAVDSAFEASWIQHLVATFGSAATASGVRYYSLDNEPALWNSTHRDVYPNPLTYDIAWSKMSEYAAAIKAQDPAALITGPEEWGWVAYFYSAKDQPPGTTPDRDAHGGTPYIEWLLQQAKAYDQANHKRLLDILTVHYYPQSGEYSTDDTQTMQQLRNRSTRSLWDPAYVDESWIGTTGVNSGIVRLIPMMKQWVQNDYPGTLVGLTEYNWGDDDHINGATAQADVLGILGREGCDIAARWGAPSAGSFTYNAFKMFRNVDGSHSAFGDTSVSAAGPNPDNIATFAAVRSATNTLTLMIISKYLTGDTPVTVNLSHFGVPAATSAQVWQLTSTNAVTHLADTAASSSMSITVPAQSITLLVIPGGNPPGAPTIGTAAPSPASAYISFTAPASDGGSAIISYNATCNPGAISATGASPIRVTGLTNGIAYTCSVTATNSVATGPSSGTVSVTPGVDAARADFNGDGKSDIVLFNTSTGGIAEWQMNGLTVMSGLVVGSPGLPWEVVATGDFNGDGHSDILLQNSTTGDIAEWQMNGNAIIAGALISSPGSAWKVAAVGDFNGDGRSDIVLQNSSSSLIALWQMNGFAITAGAIIGGGDASWKVVASGDFDGDGKSDLILRNTTTGDIAEWQMNGMAIAGGAVIGSPGTSFNVAGTGDLDGDGKADLVLQNGASGDVAGWLMNRFAITGGAIIGTPGTAWTAVGVAGYTGDGHSSILLRSSGGAIAEWQLNGLAIAAGGLVASPPPEWKPIVK